VTSLQPKVGFGRDEPALPAYGTMRVPTGHLTGVQKAAIIVRVLLAADIDLPISTLPSDLQAELTQTIGTMRLVDRATMQAVLDEFADLLEQVGIGFPDGVDGALALLGNRLDERATRKLRMSVRGETDATNPWAKLENTPDKELVPILLAESTLVGAVMLSRLSVEKAAALVALLPPPQARDLALAVARTDDLRPDAVDAIGLALAQQLADKVEPAFAQPAPKRIAAILNTTPATLRDDLLGALDQADADFAQGVRKVILTFADLPARLAPRDIPVLMRALDRDDLLTIMAAQDPQDAVTLAYILDNLSQRIADGFREDAATLPRPTRRKHEAALARIMAILRTETDAGRIALQSADPEQDE
jgi:flagellar motor switch protein FliG